MSAELPSLEAQAVRWQQLNEGTAAQYLRGQIAILVLTARQLGLRIEVV